MLRTVLLRLYGLVVAAVVAAAATILLARGVGFAVPWLTDALGSIAHRLDLALNEGLTVLAGIFALVVLVGTGYVMLGRFGRRLLRLSDTAAVEKAGVSRMVERMLRSKLEPRATVSFGRRLVASVPGAPGSDGTDLAGEASLLIPELLESLGVGDVPFRVEAGKAPGGRVK